MGNSIGYSILFSSIPFQFNHYLGLRTAGDYVEQIEKTKNINLSNYQGLKIEFEALYSVHVD